MVCFNCESKWYICSYHLKNKNDIIQCCTDNIDCNLCNSWLKTWNEILEYRKNK